MKQKSTRTRMKEFVGLIIRFAKAMLYSTWQKGFFYKLLKMQKRKKLGGTVSREQFEHLLMDLGLGPGKVVLVHSSLDNLFPLDMPPLEILNVLRKVVSPGGTLCMPAFFLRGNFYIDYFENDRCFDPERSPTSSGLLNELFRRQKGTLRSVHYTHSCCAWGAKAEELLKDHGKSETPFDEHSPFYKIIQNDGLILLLGVDFQYCTTMHVAESILDKDFPVQAFLPPTLVRVRKAGKEERVPVRFHKPYVAQTTYLPPWEKSLEEKGIRIKARKDVGFPLSVIKAREFFEYMVEEAKKGHTLFRYSGPPITIIGI